MRPEVVISNGYKYVRRNLLHWGPNRCFYQKDLYTLKFANWSSDLIERIFFGPIDSKGERSVELISEFSMQDGVHDAVQDLMVYMAAQRFRTPKGLDYVKSMVPSGDQNVTLGVMQRIFLHHTTMWTEGIWEIVRAENSRTKFILTDGPVVFFNSKAFPNSPEYKYPSDVDLGLLGTRTIFPLSRCRCLIITHTQYVRTPLANPIRRRINARAFQTAIQNLSEIQVDRELSEDEVIRINLILKQKANRYIAASEEEWLFPERHASTAHWSKLDRDWFLMPNPYLVRFTSQIIMGYSDGRSMLVDEYGRRPSHPDFDDKATRAKEWKSAQDAKVQWALRRQNASIGRDFSMGSNDAHIRMMHSDLADIDAKLANHRRRRKRIRS